MNSVSNIAPFSIAQEQLEAKRAENPKEIKGLSAQEEKLLALRQEFGEYKKDSFVFYPTYYKHLKALRKKEPYLTDEAQLFDCLCEYALYNNEPNLEELSEVNAELWEDLKADVDRIAKKSKKTTDNTTDNQERGFSLLRSHYEIIIEIAEGNAEWLELFNIYCLFGLNLQEPEESQIQSLSKIAKVYWIKDKPNLISNWIKLYNGQRGGKFGGVRKNNTPQADSTNTPPIPQADPTHTPSEPQPLSNNKNNNNRENNNNKNRERNKDENGNEVVSSSLSQDNNFSSSLSSHTPTLQEIEDYILSQEDIFVYPRKFYNHYTEGNLSFPKDWKATLRKWSDNERDKEGAKEELRYLRNQRENIEIRKLYSALYEKYKEPLYSDGISESFRNEIKIKYDVYRNLHKKGVPDQQILDTILLLIEMKHFPFIPTFCELSQFILNIDRVRKYWELSKPMYEEFITNLKKEGIDERVISYADTSFYCGEYWQMKRKGINTDLLYKAVREANKAPESLNCKYALYDILDKVIKADQAKAEQEETQADDEAHIE